jgi:hypothetical protein
VKIGQDLLDQGIIVHVSGEQNKFIDGPYWYRYAEHQAQRGKDISVKCFLTLNF